MISRHDLCPDDAVADGLLAAFDPQRLTAALARAWPAWGIVHARIARAKYKPHDKGLLGLIAQCADGVERRLSMRIVRPDRFAGLLERARREASTPDAVMPAPDLSAIAWAFPADYRMPNLHRLMDRDWVGANVIPQLAPGAAVSDWRLDVVQHAPEQSCTVRLVLHAIGPGPRTYYGKHHAAGEAGQSADILRQLTAAKPAGFGVAPIVLVQPQDGFQWQAEAPGNPVDISALFQTSEVILGRLAAAVASLHATPAITARQENPVNFERLEDRLAIAACLPASTQAELAALVARLRRGAPTSHPTPRLCHGDLHPKNMFVTPERITFIDFDAAHLAPPEYDVASFAAALIYHGIHTGLPEREITRAVESWIAAYRAAGGVIDRPYLDWLTVYCLLDERIYRCLTRLKSGRRQTAEKLIAFAGFSMGSMAHA